MRWDMFKVIVERPRYRGRSKPQSVDADRQAWRALESAPLQQPTGRGRGSKRLNENLAPLRRYLLQQIGRPWNKVHAEISAHLRLGSAVQRHVLEHLEQMVERHVVLVDGKPVRAGDRRPVLTRHWRDICYVCPRSGLLRAAPPGERTPAAPPTRDRVELADGGQLQRICGVWYHVTMAPMPASPEAGAMIFDAVLHVYLGALDRRALAQQLRQQHGRDDVYAASKRQLGKRGLARLLPEDRR